MVRIFTQALVIAAIALAAAAATQWNVGLPLYAHQEPPKKDEVTVETVQGWNTPFLWIDARATRRYREGHIPGAVLLNENNFESALAEIFPLLQDNDRTLVIYCDQRSCQASRNLAQRLRDVGLTRIFILRGGWKAWLEAGGAQDSGSGSSG